MTVSGVKKVHFGVTPTEGKILISNDAGHVDIYTIDGYKERTLPMIPHLNTMFFNSP